MHVFYVYIVRCADGVYYVGVTNDYQRRIAEHNEGMNNTCFTYLRRPVELVYIAEFNSVLQAITWEKTLKRWSRKKKEALIKGDQTALKTAAECLNGTHYYLYNAIACHAERRRSATRELLKNVVSIPRLRSG